MRHCQAPGNIASTSTSEARTNECSAPPRAGMARSSSGRGVQLAANAVRASVAISARRGAGRTLVGVGPGRSSSVGPTMARLALCLLLGVAACAGRVKPSAQPAAVVPGSEREYAVREVQLEDGAILVHLEIPSAPAGPKPAVLANLNEGPAMLGEGAV